MKVFKMNGTSMIREFVARPVDPYPTVVCTPGATPNFASLGAPLARVVHNAQTEDVAMRRRADAEHDAQRKTVEERLAKMTSRVLELETAAAIAGGGVPNISRQRMHIKTTNPRVPISNATLDQWAARSR